MSNNIGSGGFDSKDSAKSNVDKYYTYKQTGGGGGGNPSPGGGDNTGCIAAIILFGIIAVVAYLADR